MTLRRSTVLNARMQPGPSAPDHLANEASAAPLQDTASTELPLLPLGSDEVQGVRFARTRRRESAALQVAGWTRRFTALGRRLEEAVELYSQLGFEVVLEPANPEEQASAGAESCRQCFVTVYARTIYTRPRTKIISGEPSSAPVSDPIGT